MEWMVWAQRWLGAVREDGNDYNAIISARQNGTILW
jgi:hypothetical protein